MSGVNCQGKHHTNELCLFVLFVRLLKLTEHNFIENDAIIKRFKKTDKKYKKENGKKWVKSCRVPAQIRGFQVS